MALPEVRGAKSTQKTTGTEIEPALPTGTENGDLLLAVVEAFSTTGALVSITVPAGWTAEGEEQKDETASFKRTFVFCWREYTGSTGVFKFSATPTNSMNVHLVCVKKGTFKKGEPIGAKSAWTKGAASTTQTAPKATSTANGSLAIFLVCSPQSPREASPAEKWLEQAATQTSPGLGAWSLANTPAGIANGESTGEPTYKKTNSGPGWAIMLVLPPATGATSFERSATEEVKVAESVTFNGGNSRGVTESASVAETVIRTGNLVRKPTESVSVAETVAFTKGQGREATESINVAEATARVEGSPRLPEEVTVVEDVATRTAASPRSASESYSIAESIVRVEGSPRVATETYSVGEVATRGAQPSTRASSDAISVAENVTQVGSFARFTSDAVAVGEAVTSAGGRTSAVGDSINVAESATRHVGVRHTLVAEAHSTISLTREVRRGLSASATPTPTVVKASRHSPTAQASASIVMARRPGRVLSATQASSATLVTEAAVVALVLSEASSGPSMLATTTVEPKYEIEVGA